MELETVSALLIGWTALAAAALSPGPNMVAVASRALGSGRAAGVFVSLGIGFGAFIWAWLSSLGFSQLLSSYPELIQTLSLLGGGYLLYLGYKGFRSALSVNSSFISPTISRDPLSDITYGLAVTLSNPKVAILWASLATIVAPGLHSMAAVVSFSVGSACVVFVIYSTYAVLFSIGIAQEAYRRFSRVADAIFGGLFSSLGALLLGQSNS